MEAEASNTKPGRPGARRKVIKAQQNPTSDGEESGREDLGTTRTKASRKSKGKQKASQALPNSASEEDLHQEEKRNTNK